MIPWNAHLLESLGIKTTKLACLLLFAAAGSAFAQNLVVDGDFEAAKSSKQLRTDNKGSDWYESRKDTDAGRALLKLSSKAIGGNATRKAMIKAHPDLNTYLSHKLLHPLEASVTASFDIFIKEILPDDNHSAFFFLGGIKDKAGGPNSTGSERFVFLGFENAGTPGKINLFAREGASTWEERTLVAPDLELNRWYTIQVKAEIPEGYYTVAVKGVTPQPFDLESFFTKGKTPSKITHVSFASWNDGAGTFYVDNVSVSGL